jgi:hypothetical protein
MSRSPSRVFVADLLKVSMEAVSFALQAEKLLRKRGDTGCYQIPNCSEAPLFTREKAFPSLAI